MTAKDLEASGEKPDLNGAAPEVKEEAAETLLAHQQGNRKEEKVKPELGYQVFCVLVVSFGCYIHGTGLAFPAVTIPLLYNNNTMESLGFYMDPISDVSWITSLASVGMCIGSLISGPISNYLGRRWTYVLGNGLNFALAFTLVVTVVDVYMLYAARLLMGMGLGFSFTISTLYIQDIASPSMRGSFGAIPGVTGCLGLNTYQILGSYLDWKTLNTVFAILPVTLVLLLFLIPESPVYLVSVKKIEEARSGLIKLRGKAWDVDKEISEIQARLGGYSRTKLNLSTFKNLEVLKPLMIGTMLMVFMNLSGINVVFQYTVEIFKSSKVSIDPFLANVYVGLAILASNIFSVLVAHKLPRRLLMMTTAMGLSITLGILGLSYQFIDWEKECIKNIEANKTELTPEDEEAIENCHYHVGMLPVIDLMVYMFSFNIGYGSLIFITVMELQPCHVREFCNSWCISVTTPVSFITTYTYKSIEPMIGGQGFFWTYSLITFTGFLFIAMFVPETRGKTEEDIQKNFKKNPSPSNSC